VSSLIIQIGLVPGPFPIRKISFPVRKDIAADALSFELPIFPKVPARLPAEFLSPVLGNELWRKFLVTRLIQSSENRDQFLFIDPEVQSGIQLLHDRLAGLGRKLRRSQPDRQGKKDH